jgi:catalase
MLQARLFAYHDAQLYRVGANHQQLPVNQARCPVHNQQRDGAMALANGGVAANYDPVHGALPAAGGFGHGDAGWELSGAAGRYDPRADDDYFSQPGALYRLLDDQARQALIDNIAASLGQADAAIQARQIALFAKADPAYGDRVAAAISNLQDR